MAYSNLNIKIVSNEVKYGMHIKRLIKKVN